MPLLAVLCGSCCLRTAQVSIPETLPDMSAVMAVTGRFGWAEACPVGPTTVLTSAHVIDLRPFDNDVPLVPLRWEDQDGHAGMLKPAGVFAERDLAIMTPSEGQLQHWFIIAEHAPSNGEPLWFVGWDYRKNKGLSPRVWRANLLRIRAGTLVYSEPGEPGSSGSCILNAEGRVVGIVRGWASMHNDGRVGTGVAIYGESFLGKEKEEGSTVQ